MRERERRHKKCNEIFISREKLCQPAAESCSDQGNFRVRGLAKEMRPICSHRCNSKCPIYRGITSPPPCPHCIPCCCCCLALWSWEFDAVANIVVDTRVLAFKTDSQATAAVGSKKEKHTVTHTHASTHKEREEWQS